MVESIKKFDTYQISETRGTEARSPRRNPTAAKPGLESVDLASCILKRLTFQLMNCIHCGQPLTPGARFCVSCGREQVDHTVPKPPATPPPFSSAPTPLQQLYSGPLSPSGTPAVPASPGSSAKIIFILAAVLLLVLGIGGAVAYFYFFPPGVFVKDSFRRSHPQLESKIRNLGNAARFFNNTLEIDPPNKQFYSLTYGTVVSDHATVEGTVEWKEGDKSTLFGIVCCAIDQDEFYVLMINGHSEYTLQSYERGTWVDLTGFLDLPKMKVIKKNVPYKLKIITEGDYISAFLNDELLVKLLDPVDHKGKPGIYAQGGESGKSTVAFHSLRAKKNSMFQSD